jgi:amino acid transporter
MPRRGLGVREHGSCKLGDGNMSPNYIVVSALLTFFAVVAHGQSTASASPSPSNPEKTVSIAVVFVVLAMFLVILAAGAVSSGGFDSTQTLGYADAPRAGTSRGAPPSPTCTCNQVGVAEVQSRKPALI